MTFIHTWNLSSGGYIAVRSNGCWREESTGPYGG